MSSSSIWVRNSFEMSSKFKLFSLFSAETRSPKWVRTQNEFGTHFRTHPKGSAGRPVYCSAWNRSQKVVKKWTFFGPQVLLRVHQLSCPPFGTNVSSFGRPQNIFMIRKFVSIFYAGPREKRITARFFHRRNCPPLLGLGSQNLSIVERSHPRKRRRISSILRPPCLFAIFQ